MLLHRCWLLGWLLCLGCHSVEALDAVQEVPHAEDLWDKGQAAMGDGQPERAIGFYEQSLRADPSLTRNHMSLAAAYLESGDEQLACVHLGEYLATHAEDLEVRGHYAELLLRLKREPEARAEYEHCVADAQELGDQQMRQMVHCHSRLVELAETHEDEYSAHLNRGIGLYLVARQRAGLDDPQGELPTEGLLCKAAGELSVARFLRPREARPCWYLQRVWAHLGQTQAAARWLREASSAASFSYLTPAEQRSLVLVRGTAVPMDRCANR